eukprot:CAMPEP_0179030996 /NCGR_PEP_ID=MMETSP0796-20121207/10847_1 /TAXON_ID=73915 /ORGANISM="Pyrodinium bahamense, Strain pbaha01" /LENGTH=176 /DNA_ID=CAMNT_0020727183 /DNA_START=425 /DNA_END=952 /DNA_ORIENTATION=+
MPDGYAKEPPLACFAGFEHIPSSFSVLVEELPVVCAGCLLRKDLDIDLGGGQPLHDCPRRYSDAHRTPRGIQALLAPMNQLHLWATAAWPLVPAFRILRGETRDVCLESWWCKRNLGGRRRLPAQQPSRRTAKKHAADGHPHGSSQHKQAMPKHATSLLTTGSTFAHRGWACTSMM